MAVHKLQSGAARAGVVATGLIAQRIGNTTIKSCIYQRLKIRIFIPGSGRVKLTDRKYVS